MAAKPPKDPKKTRAVAKQRTAAKILKLAKSAPVPAAEHSFDVRDASKVLDAAKIHAVVLKAVGFTDAEQKAFVAQITLAKKHENGGQRLSLENARHEVKDLLGAYRKAARLAGNSLAGRDVKLLETLRVDVAFPDNDTLLDAYLDGIAVPVHAHSERLSLRGFPKAQQTKFIAAAEAFRDAVSARPDRKVEHQTQSTERARVFAALRTMTTYIRELGHEALSGSPQRSDFDRLPSVPRPPKAKT